MRRKIIVSLLMLGASLFAQQRWEKIYGFGGEGRSVIQLLDGNYIVGGGSSRFFLMKLNAFGDSIWSRALGGISHGYFMQKTRDGGYILAGDISSTNDVYVIKTDSLGDSLRAKTYGGSASDIGYDVQQTSDGGFIIVGGTSSFGNGAYDFYLIKTDSLGDSLWTKTYGGPGWDLAYSLQIATDGGYIIAGMRSPTGNNGYVHLLKTNASGDSVWARTFGRGCGYSVAKTSDGGYIITGSVLRGTYTDVYLIKTNSNGDSIWSKTYNGPRNFSDIGYSVHQTADGGYIIAGEAGTFPDPLQYDVYLIKTNDRGDTVWTRTWRRSLTNVGYSVQQTMDGGYIIAGRTGESSGSLYLIKTDAQGNSLIEEEYQLSTNRYRSHSIDLLVQSPIRNHLYLCYQATKGSKIDIEIFDITGRRIEIIYSGYASAGNRRIRKSVSLPAGVYFIKLKSSEDVITKKVIVLH